MTTNGHYPPDARLPTPTRYPPMPQCKPTKPTAEEMLKKALEYAYQGMKENSREYYDSFIVGNYHAYEMMAAHLEMLIKEARQDG